jgi:hypothetical protein
VDAPIEDLLSGQLDSVLEPDIAQVAAESCAVDRLDHGALSADRLDHAVGTDPAGELGNLRGALGSPLLHHIGGAEVAGHLLPVGVPAHHDHSLGAELTGGQHRAQAHGAITNDRNRLPGPRMCGDRSVPAGSQHIRGCQQRGQKIGSGFSWRGHQGAIGPGHAQHLGLSADTAHQHPIETARLESGLADLAGVVRCPERSHDEVARLDGVHLGADLVDHTDVLVALRHRLRHGHNSPPGPQVGAAHAGRDHPDHSIGGLLDPRVRAFLDPYIPRPMHHYSEH